MICEQCETVAHCLEHGCVPKQPMPTKDEALKLAKIWFEYNTYGDEAIEVYEAIEQALAAPAQEIVCSTGLCHYKPAAPVQELAGYFYLDDGQWKQAHDPVSFPGCTKLYTTPPAKQQPAVPQGWKLVPVEPTPEMLEEFKRAYKDGDFWRERIHGAVCAMLAAAPEQKGNV
jgi:hypothetical protein